jgi:hypothetical protein
MQEVRRFPLLTVLAVLAQFVDDYVSLGFFGLVAKKRKGGLVPPSIRARPDTNCSPRKRRRFTPQGA